MHGPVLHGLDHVGCPLTGSSSGTISILSSVSAHTGSMTSTTTTIFILINFVLSLLLFLLLLLLLLVVFAIRIRIGTTAHRTRSCSTGARTGRRSSSYIRRMAVLRMEPTCELGSSFLTFSSKTLWCRCRGGWSSIRFA